jgi:hypothetical protein
VVPRAGQGSLLSTRERVVLGVPSLVLGVVPLVAPKATARLLGLGDGPVGPVVRAVGVRELVIALAFLRGRSPRWLWAFVAQDALDLPVLGWWLVTDRGSSRRRLRRTIAGYLVMATVDVCTAVRQNVVADRLSGARP